MLFHCPQKADKACSRPVIVYDTYLKSSGLLKAALPAFCTKQKLYIRYCSCSTIYRPPKRGAYIVVANTISYILHSPCPISIFYRYTILPFYLQDVWPKATLKNSLNRKLGPRFFVRFSFSGAIGVFHNEKRLPKQPFF